MVAIVFGILVIQHAGIEIYNYNIENQNEKLINESDKQIYIRWNSSRLNLEMAKSRLYGR